MLRFLFASVVLAGLAMGCSNLTPSSGTSNCASVAYLCNNSVYYTLMTQQCPATCGRCNTTVTTTSSSSSSTTCLDKTGTSGTSDCASRAYLCNNSIYYTLMTQQCPRTCGRCSGKK